MKTKFVLLSLILSMLVVFSSFDFKTEKQGTYTAKQYQIIADTSGLPVMSHDQKTVYVPKYFAYDSKFGERRLLTKEEIKTVKSEFIKSLHNKYTASLNNKKQICSECQGCGGGSYYVCYCFQNVMVTCWFFSPSGDCRQGYKSCNGEGPQLPPGE